MVGNYIHDKAPRFAHSEHRQAADVVKLLALPPEVSNRAVEMILAWEDQGESAGELAQDLWEIFQVLLPKPD